MSFECSGVWIRKTGGNPGKPYVEVLVELGEAEGTKHWRLICREPVAAFAHGEVSHIVETAGVLSATIDDL